MGKTKVNLSADQISQKWNTRMKQSIGDIQNGINGVTDSPMEKAASKQDKMLQNLTASVQNGKWKAGLAKVSLAEWKQKTSEKVASRLSGGVDAAMSKRKDFDSYLVNTLNGVLPKINSMPDMTLEDSVNKVRALMEHMHNNPYKK